MTTIERSVASRTLRLRALATGGLLTSILLLAGCSSSNPGGRANDASTAQAAAAAASSALASAEQASTDTSAVAAQGAGTSETAGGSGDGAGTGTSASAAVTGTVDTGSVAAAGDATASSAPSGGQNSGIALVDPCQKLTKADVQPFFTIPIATELPSSVVAPGSKGCEWAAGNVGLQTSLDIVIYTGQPAQDFWNMIFTVGLGGRTMFTGVGDKAEHLPGDTSFVAISGSGVSSLTCGITTIGFTTLVPLEKLSPGDVPNASATMVAQQLGTLCNKIFGRGNTKATQTTSGIAPLTSAPLGPVAAVGGTMPGTTFPLPVGLDCSGSKTGKDTLEGGVSCDTTSTDPKSVYAFYLSVLPTKGYTISQQEEATTNGTVVASMHFTGPDAAGFSGLSIIGKMVEINLQPGN